MRKSWLILVLAACLPLTVGLDCDDIGVADALYFVNALTGPVYVSPPVYGGNYYYYYYPDYPPDDYYYDDYYYDYYPY